MHVKTFGASVIATFSAVTAIHAQDHDSVFRSPPALQADSLVLSRLVRRDRCDVFRRSAHAVDLLCRLERRDWYRSEPRHASILAAAGWLGDVQAVLDSLSVCRAIRL